MLIYLDLETTGLEKMDRLCAIGLISIDGDDVETKSEQIKPPKRIGPDAMAVHHITNEMVRDAPDFSESDTLRWLEAHNDTANILVAHNIAFDLGMLQKEGFIWQGGMIDTLKCTKHLITEIDRFSLQYLRYELGLYKDEGEIAQEMGIELRAHTPLSDALHVWSLHRYLNAMADDEALMELTSERALIKKFSFGKYKGRYIEEIAMRDRGYLQWMLDTLLDMDEDLRYSVEHYFREVR